MPTPLPVRSRSSLRGFLTILTACALPAALTAANWAPNFTASATWNDNATNSPTSDDQLDSLQLTADVIGANEYSLGRADVLQLAGHIGGEWWPRYQSLLAGMVGGRAEWRHSFGVGTLAPTFSIEGAADLVGARERGREGTTTGVTAALRKRLNAQWRIAIRHELGRHDARQAVYDRTSSESSFELGFDASNVSRFTLSARYRDGDVIAYTAAPDAGLISVTRATAPVSTFDRPQIASSFEARTWAARVAYLRALDTASAIVVAYEIRKSRAQPVEFTNQLLSVSVVHQF